MSKIRVVRLAMSSVVVGLLGVAAGCSCDSDNGNGGAGGASGFDGGAAVGGSGGFSGLGGFGGSAGTGGTGTCAEANITATNGIPTIWLLIDGSSSMQQDYGNTTRWRALREALVGPDGVLRELDDRINFGMAIYAGRYIDEDGDPINPQNACPIPGTPIPPTMSVPIHENCNGVDSGDCGQIIGTMAGQNFPQLEAALPGDRSPGERTPSGEALNWLYDQLEDGIIEPDNQRAPIYVIFATDGEPNSCSGGGGSPTFQLSEDAIARGRDLQVTTYVISLAQGNDLTGQFAAHLQRAANLGAGLDANAMPGAMLYSPQDPQELSMALETLLTATLGCTAPLRGTLQDVSAACTDGVVRLNGEILPCDDPNGWTVDSAGRNIILQGSACEMFMNSAAVMVNATFACDSIVPD
jgi:hypothetical protein